MAHNHIASDSPLSCRIVRAFLHFLDSVEPGPRVDAEGIEVARECLAEAFKLNSSPVAGEPVKPDSLIDIFKSLEANKQCETSKLDVSPQPDYAAASSSFSGENPARVKNHSEGDDSTQGPHAFVPKDELCVQFFAALEKNNYFGTNTDGSDDPVQVDKASSLFEEACMVTRQCKLRDTVMQLNCIIVPLHFMKRVLFTTAIGQLLSLRLTNIQKRSKIVLAPSRSIQTTARHTVVWVWFIMHKEITEMLLIKGLEKVGKGLYSSLVIYSYNLFYFVFLLEIIRRMLTLLLSSVMYKGKWWRSITLVLQC
ncbi:small glutamine-rich tetratricopeptide repeat-containing protein 2 isoform X4 [Spatholobus suberectus]|nr:small glutamine-rich tetratricopeptide repeat-containing protein 2 isoform X4 [Spatholobus suberectus]